MTKRPLGNAGFALLLVIEVLAVGGLVAGLFATGAAMAADMPLKALPPPPVTTNWSGGYVGVNGGYVGASTTWNFPVVQFFADVAGQGYSMRANSGMFGGQAGYNMQNNWLVFGLELKGDWTNLNHTQVGGVSPTFPADVYKTKLQDVETLSMRLGYAPANWLFYLETGAASATIQLSGVSGLPIPNVAFSNSQRVGGFALGGGVETIWASHFVLGVEYQYVLLNDSVNTLAFCTNAATCAGRPITTVNIAADPFRVQSVVGRASYKF